MINLVSIRAKYDFTRPYRPPKDEEITGYGFIIDSSKGLVLTNSNIVENSISILGKIDNKKDLYLEVIGICREKELALCKMNDISNYKTLKFADSILVKVGDKISSSENIGIISGLNTESYEREDSLTRIPIYMYSSFEGCMGQPVFNSMNEVIGMFSKENRIIPSRTILAVYPEMISSKIVKMPTLGLDWCSTNRELMKKQTGTSSTYGIYVKKVHPGSCLDRLEKGDVIRRIDYMDCFWNSDGSENKSTFALKNFEKKTLVTIFLDRFGMTTSIGKLKDPNELDETKLEFEKIFTNRKLNICEVVDMIPIGTEMTLNMCRESRWYKLKTEYIFMSSERPDYIYPQMEKLDYEFFAGICFSNLYINESYEYEKKSVIINKIFQEGYAYKTQSLKIGQKVKTVFAYDDNFEFIKDSHIVISSLEDMRKVLMLKPSYIQLTMSDESTFICLVKNIVKEDIELMKKYQINHNYILN